MGKYVLGLCLIFGVNLYADLISDGIVEYDKSNYKQAIKLWDEACGNGSIAGCNNVAFMYANGKGVHYDEKRASELYTLTCDAGDSTACSNLGAIYENGVGKVRQNFVKASRLYAKSCDAGNVMGCNNLADAYYKGRGVARWDTQLAANIYADTCDRGSIYGCYSLAQMYRKGKGIQQNRSKAKALYAKACNMGNNGSCRRYRRLHDEGVK